MYALVIKKSRRGFNCFRRTLVIFVGLSVIFVGLYCCFRRTLVIFVRLSVIFVGLYCCFRRTCCTPGSPWAKNTRQTKSLLIVVLSLVLFNIRKRESTKVRKVRLILQTFQTFTPTFQDFLKTVVLSVLWYFSTF